MKKPLLAATVLAACLASQAYAQASNFQGLSLGLGLNMADTKTESGAASASDTDNNGVLQVQYNWALGNAFVLGAGATANLGDLKAGKFGAAQAKEKDAYSLFVAPGYAFNSSLLGYGKLAYLNAKLENGAGTSLNFDDGYGLGLGVQALFSRSWFLQAELMANKFSDRSTPTGTTVKLKSDAFSLTAGYKF
ncbi:MAG: porin family protein [Rhodoferax sp.]|nr:porin family protein [Rhodoferax sp.]